MMKWKDCIHYTAHKHFYFGEEDFDEYFNDDNVESQCPEFEDKKEWLKLPCKVGIRFINSAPMVRFTKAKFRKYTTIQVAELHLMKQQSENLYFPQKKLPKRHSQKGAENEQMH